MLKVKVRKMSAIRKENRKYICNCPTMCKRAINLEGNGYFCEGQALEFAYNLIFLLKGGPRKETPNTSRQRAWTTSEIQYILDWAESGFKYGDYNLIAKALGRTRISVKSRIDYMKKRGMI